jgi:hypothetical protein
MTASAGHGATRAQLFEIDISGQHDGWSLSFQPVNSSKVTVARTAIVHALITVR